MDGNAEIEKPKSGIRPIVVAAVGLAALLATILWMWRTLGPSNLRIAGNTLGAAGIQHIQHALDADIQHQFGIFVEKFRAIEKRKVEHFIHARHGLPHDRQIAHITDRVLGGHPSDPYTLGGFAIIVLVGLLAAARSLDRRRSPAA